jgi:uncharacterized membrane protein
MDLPLSGHSAAVAAHVREARTPADHAVTGSNTRVPTAPLSRLSGIDAARGIAMIMVCLSHIRYHFDEVPEIYALLTYITRVATPTFLLLSGFVAAHVLSSGRAGARIAVIDRALCVLIVGHLLLNIEQLPQVGVAEWLLARVTVTDAIALCLIVAAMCAQLPTRLLLFAGAALALVSWPIAITAGTDWTAGQRLLVVMFDVRSGHNNLVDAAIAPYLGVFLIGMGLSKSSKLLIATRQDVLLARRLFMFGIIAVGSVLVAAFLWHELKGVVPSLLGSSETAVLFRQTLNPLQKLPPSPAYLALYGGAGLLIAAACLARRPRVLLEPAVKWAATIGRASLMAFVVQDWVLRSVPVLFGFDHLPSPFFWGAYFIGTLLVLHWCAERWDAARANRFLTVGMKWLHRKYHAASAHETAPVEPVHGLR